MPSNVFPRGTGHAARVTLNGRQVWLGTYPTRELAERAVARARGGDMPPTSTVAEWAAIWQQIFPGKRNEETARHNEQMVRAFVELHGHRRLDVVSVWDAQVWASRSPGSVRYLRLMFGKAVKAGLLEVNVWSRVEVPTEEPRVPPTVEELERMVALARARGGWWEHFADLVVFTAYSGLRLEEVADGQAADRLGPGRLVVRGKRRPGETCPRERVVAVLGPAAEALGRAPAVGRLWRSKRGRRLNRDSVGRAFRSVAREAGYDGSFHALRHFCATWLLDLGASQQDVAIQLGHVDRAGHADTTQVRQRYGHPDVERALSRLATLETGSKVNDEEGSNGRSGDGLRGAGADAAAADGRA